MILETAVLFVFPALMCFAAASDLVSMRISNRIVLGLAVGFVVVAVGTGLSLSALALHVAAAAVALGVCFGFFAAGWMGGGDAKLVAVTALWFGFGSLADYALLAAAFGGVLTLGLIMLRTVPLPAALSRQAWAARLHRLDTGIPYGIALAAAALIVFPHTALFQAAVS